MATPQSTTNHTSDSKSNGTKVQRALHWFQYVSKGGLPLLLSVMSALLLIFGALGLNLSTLLLLVSITYVLYLYSAPIIKYPKGEISEVILLTLPLLWVTSLWVIAASFSFAIDGVTPISAFIYGLVLSLVPRFMIPILFLVTICFELSLIIRYQLSLSSAIFHLAAHLLSALTLPRRITPQWVIRSLYPRLLDIDELPLKDRFFDPSKFRASHDRVSNVSISRERSGAPLNPNPNLTSDGLEWDSSPIRSDDSLSVSSSSSSIRTDLDEKAENIAQESGLGSERTALSLSRSVTPMVGNVTSLLKSYSPIQGELEIEAAVRAHNDQAIDFINRSLKVHLELLRQQLHVETAVLVWLRPEGERLEIRAVETIRDEWTHTQFDRRYGILDEALTEPLSFNDPIEAHCLVPYYDESLTIGGLLSYPIFMSDRDHADGIVLVDRGSNESWDQTDRATLRIVAEKIALDIETSRLIRQVAFDGGQVERLCYSLRLLNESFTLSEVADCAVTGVGSYHGFESATFFSVAEGEGLRLVARWIDPKLQRQYHSQPSLDVGSFIVWSNLPIFESLSEGEELSTLTRPISPSDYLPVEDFPLLLAKSAVAMPLKDSQTDGVLGLLILTASHDEMIQQRHMAALNLLFEQVTVKLSSISAHDRLREMALCDGLTGLKNHMTFQSQATEMLRRAERDQQPLTIVLIDIDHFKSVNDTYGHPFGDEVLKRVALTLERQVRDVDLVARYGGEEFSMVLHATDLDQALVSIERVRQSVENLTFSYEGEEVRVTISVGLACYPLDSREKDRLIDKADKALYQSKRNGRNQLTAWRTIAPEQRDSSVGWTRHPSAFVPQYIDEDQAISSVLISPVALGDQGGGLPFDLEEMVPMTSLEPQAVNDGRADTQHDMITKD